MRKYFLRVPRNEFETAKQILIRENIQIVHEAEKRSTFIIEISREKQEKLKSQHQHWQFFSDLKFETPKN